MKTKSIKRFILFLLPLLLAFFTLSIFTLRTEKASKFTVSAEETGSTTCAYPMRAGKNAFANGRVWTVPTPSETSAWDKVFLAFTPSVAMDNENGYLAMQVETDKDVSLILDLLVSNTAGSAFVPLNIATGETVYFIDEYGNVATQSVSNSVIGLTAGSKGVVVMPMSAFAIGGGYTANDVNWAGYSRLYLSMDVKTYYGINLKLGELGYFANDTASMVELIDLSTPAGGANIYLEIKTTSALSEIATVAEDYVMRTGENAFANGKNWNIATQTETDAWDKIFLGFTPSTQLTQNGYLAIQVETDTSVSLQIDLLISNTAGNAFVPLNIATPSNVYFMDEAGNVTTQSVSYSVLNLTAGSRGVVIMPVSAFAIGGGYTASDVNWAGYSRLYMTMNVKTYYGINFKIGELGYFASKTAGMTKFIDLSTPQAGDNIFLEVKSISEATAIPEICTITFNNEDGTEISSAKYPYGATVEVPEAPTKDADETYSYTFDGWDSEVTTVSGNKVYTAVFKATYVDYEISYDLQDGVVATANPEIYNAGTDTFTLNNPTKENYTFLGWTGTDLSEPTMEVVIEQGSTGDRSYVANWEEINQGGEGGEVTPPEGGEGGEVTPPAGGDDEGGEVTPPAGGDDEGGEVTPPAGGDDEGGDVTPPAGGDDTDETPNETPETPTDEPEEESGCSGIIGVGAVVPAMLAILGVCLVKAKKED